MNKYSPLAGAGGAQSDLFFDFITCSNFFKFHLPSPTNFRQPTIDLTCCCKKDFDLKIMVIFSPDFLIIASSNVLMGVLELHEEDLKVEKSLFPSSNLAAFFISLKFKRDLMCHPLLNSNDNFIKNNKVSKEIIENTKYFRDKVNSL